MANEALAQCPDDDGMVRINLVDLIARAIDKIFEANQRVAVHHQDLLSQKADEMQAILLSPEATEIQRNTAAQENERFRQAMDRVTERYYGSSFDLPTFAAGFVAALVIGATVQGLKAAQPA